jgi:hypothetical protein
MERGKAASAAIALALGSLLALASQAAASHVRPKGATPLVVPLVPAYKQCLNPNRAHGAPLASPSCNQPTLQTQYTTIGTPDANGAGANSIGFFRFYARPADIRLSLSLTDIRCTSATAASVCNSANAADGPDYSGELGINEVVRITDHNNGSSLTEAATMTDIPFPVKVTCTNTASTAQGAECAITTSANGVVPGSVTTGQRTIWEVGQVMVYDGGAGGDLQTPDGGFLLKQGLFVP